MRIKNVLFTLERLLWFVVLGLTFPLIFVWFFGTVFIAIPAMFIFFNQGLDNTTDFMLEHEPHFLWLDSIKERHYDKDY